MVSAAPPAPPASRRPRAARAATALGALAAAATLALGVLAPTARADEAAITTQDYVSVYDFADLRAQGLDGSGVTIAMIDGPVDTTVPELAGADITSTQVCPIDQDAAYTAHGTAVASVLASPAYGWAPEAKILSYELPFSNSWELPPECLQDGKHTFASLINQAINDGADLINVSVGAFDTPTFAAVRAAQLGIPVVFGAGNDSIDVLGLGQTNGLVTVGATDLDAHIASYSDHGPGLTVVAPGEPITMREADDAGALTRIAPGHSGTSFAAPMVTGLLALGMQKYPEASGNQLLRTLIATAASPTSGTWDEYWGWGLIQSRDFLDADPADEDTSDPLMDKVPGERPTAEDVADYRDGLVDPDQILNDPSYVYRGVDEYIVASHPEISQLGTSPRYRTRLPGAEASSTPSSPGAEGGTDDG